MASTLTRAIVHNEGCDLHCWHQGNGPLITFVPGGNGHGLQFFPLMAALSDRFTVATFDRRQMSASQTAVNKRLNPPQQARDIRAVITALSFNKAIVFGSSSGGMFALQFAHDFPGMVEHVIAHEAPTITLLPDSSEILEWFLHLMQVYDARGLEQAAAEFRERLNGYDDEGVPAVAAPDPRNREVFWADEFPVLLGWVPNLWRLIENKTSVGVMRGARTGDAFFARTVDEQAKILGCPKMLVPGHHQGFEVETHAFVPYLLDMLDLLEKRRGAVEGEGRGGGVA
ncbi:Alpha/Beta hydrolase protein [Lasiosphaeria miniovina]|uniref:Alpha/Beta hydrolase protein n=1 Tax=Lasiosphaeria miniovina TaxID=1954250 RepID=A0AA40BF14_9PEZI|nr:Alpha/Beta hydrolase protein [Lasiosphaeria miniovina]KAK0733065.1 Alpha/Beta hydrolase protein [Lasiosphaeria miniovina]